MNVEQMTFDIACGLRDEAMSKVEINANEHAPEFSQRAGTFVVEYLAAHGSSSGEDITNSCLNAGIIPHDDRAFGPVYMRLARSGQIKKAGFCKRKKGHGTSGGNIWELCRAQ